MTHRPWTRALCGLLLTAALAPSAHAQPPRATQETLRYEVRFRGAHVARVSMRTGCPVSGHTPAALTASSQGLAEDLHAFHVRLDSFFDPASTLPAQGRTTITEEGRTRRYKSTFAAKPPGVSVSAKVFGEPRPRVSHPTPARAHDLLSWLHHFRREQTRWAPGASQRYYVWDGWKLVRLDATIRGIQTVTTPHGIYASWVVDVRRVRMTKRAGGFAPAAEAPDELGTIWFTQGGDHVIVGMDFASRLGMAHIRLASAERVPCDPEEKAPSR